MELLSDPHSVLPIKCLIAHLYAVSLRAHFSYLVQGCLLLELRGGAVVGYHELSWNVEAVWILLNSIESVVAPIRGNVLRAEDNDF